MLADAGPAVGAYFGEALPTEATIRAFEARTAARCSIVSYYHSWGLGFSDAPIAFARTLLHHGRVPLLTWEPWSLPDPERDPSANAQFSLSRILSGAFDTYIDWFAHRLSRLPGPILLRPMHEMNGNWYPWCGTTNSNRPEEFVDVWRRLRRMFARRGVRNVSWVWCPYALSVPSRSDNELERYFPGDDEVDVLGLDGYNWGDRRPWSRWQTFDEIFGTAHRILTALSAKPVVIAELGCAERGGDKARWLRDAWIAAREYAWLRGVVWFNVKKECDWRVDASTEALDAFREGWGYEPPGRASLPALR